jgi:hypothetical protein
MSIRLIRRLRSGHRALGNAYPIIIGASAGPRYLPREPRMMSVNHLIPAL